MSRTTDPTTVRRARTDEDRAADDPGMAAIGVLGPLRVRGPGGPIPVPSARQRRLLLGMVARLGTPVPADELADLGWDAPPANPPGAVHTNIARLRRLLPEGTRIVTAPEGYQLVAERSAVDVTVFTDHLAAASASPDPSDRLSLLEAALALWRGRPYAELDHPSLHPEAARLSELRAGAAEQHGAALIAVGRIAEAIAALEWLIVADPLRESAVALLMRALVTAGRQADALAEFGRLHRRLAEDLGLDPSPPLRELQQQVLRQEVPITAVPSGPSTRSRVPRLPVSTFVGRADDVARVGRLLGEHRIVTLCGPGGVGKTRLATHVAAEIGEGYDDGVLLVGFGEGGPADVAPALLAALRLADDGRAHTGTLADRVVEVLAVRRQLVVFDNCEHVADEVAGLVETIAMGAHGVDLLLTSREPVRVDGEFVFGVDPLDPVSAARLLTERMGAAGLSHGEPDRAELVALVCRRLDGLPLALELAAARAVSLGLRGLVDALDRPFDLLRGGRRTAARRHASLHDVVEWSYELLDGDQRTLFERLAVFAGPVERAAVTAVCGDAAALPDLLDRSLVRLVARDGLPAQYGMLETLRAFGRSKLATDPAGAALRARHAAWAVRFAEEVLTDRRGPGEAAAIRRFDAHLPDLRRAHAWLCEVGPAEDLLRLTLPFGLLAHLRGRVDLMRQVEEAVTAAGVPGRTGAHPPHPLAARLLGLLAVSSWQRGDLAAVESLTARAVALAGAAGDPTAGRDALNTLTEAYGFRGDRAGAIRNAHRSLELAMAAGDLDSQVLAHVDLVIHSAYAGDDAAAVRYEAAMAEPVARLGSPTARAWFAYVRGERLAELGDPAAAGHLREAIGLAEEVGSDFVAGVARHTLVTTAARAGAASSALAEFGPLIDHWHGFGAWTQLWIAVRALIETLSRLARHADVAVLLGAAGASARAPWPSGADAVRAGAVEQAARAALGPGFEALLAQGAALGDSGAVGLARRLARELGATATTTR